MKVNMGQPNELLLDDLELILREIDEFNTALINNKPANIPQSLENYLQFVARSGNTVFPWPHVRNLIRTKMVSAIQQFQEPTCPNESFVLERFDLFRLAAPFTVQRLTELILQPTRHYRKKEKFLRGLEKTVLVVSTVEPHSLTNDEERNGNDINNTSSSSCEAETETVAFNRTITLDSHDLLTTAVRTSSSMDILPHEGVVLDPVAVSTTAVGTHVDAINQNITITSDGGIISENVITSAISSEEIITPDKVAVVSSDAVASETLATTTDVSSMDIGEDVRTSSSVDIIPHEVVVLDPIAVTTTGTHVDQSITITSVGGIISENVITSAISSEEVITPADKVPVVSSDAVSLAAVPETLATTTGVSSMDTGEEHDLLSTDTAIRTSSSVDIIPHEVVVLDPVGVSTTAVSTHVDVLNQNITITSDGGIISENVITSAISSEEVIITPDKVAAVSSDAASLAVPSETLATTTTGLSSMDTGESSSVISSDEVVITPDKGPAASSDAATLVVASETLAATTTDVSSMDTGEDSSPISSDEVITPADKVPAVSSDTVSLATASETLATTTGVSSMDSG